MDEGGLRGCGFTTVGHADYASSLKHGVLKIISMSIAIQMESLLL